MYKKVNSLLKKLSLHFLLVSVFVTFCLDLLYHVEFFLFQLQWLCTRRVHKIYRLSAGPQLARSCFSPLSLFLSFRLSLHILAASRSRETANGRNARVHRAWFSLTCVIRARACPYDFRVCVHSYRGNSSSLWYFKVIKYKQ